MHISSHCVGVYARPYMASHVQQTMHWLTFIYTFMVCPGIVSYEQYDTLVTLME